MVDVREVLADLGPIEVEVEEGDIITDLMVLIRVQKLQDTDDALVLGNMEHTGGIVNYGMIMAAKLQMEKWMTEPQEEDDE